MSTQATTVRRDPDLLGQTVIVIGGSAGIGLETARRARAEGARVVLTGRNRERLAQAAHEIGAERTAAFDANEAAELETFFGDLATPADHVMVTAGAPRYRPPFELTPDDARRGFSEHLMLALNVARSAAGKVRAGGSLTFMGGTGARRPRRGLAIVSTATAAYPALIANLALELAPIRVNLIAAGSSTRRSRLRCLARTSTSGARNSAPRCRSAGSFRPADVAALAVHLMSNSALTGATYDIDGGQQLVS